jgi:hypothetical protein
MRKGDILQRGEIVGRQFTPHDFHYQKVPFGEIKGHSLRL